MMRPYVLRKTHIYKNITYERTPEATDSDTIEYRAHAAEIHANETECMPCQQVSVAIEYKGNSYRRTRWH